MPTSAIRPHIISSLQCYEVEEQKVFKFSIRSAFWPQDNSLYYQLTSSTPSWINIDSSKGIIYGIAPKVQVNHPYKITVVVGNEMGSVTQSFILKVLCIDVIEMMSHTLTYSLNKQKYGYHHIHPYTPDLLEYIFNFSYAPKISFYVLFLKSAI
jgi:hypothetical protein